VEEIITLQGIQEKAWNMSMKLLARGCDIHRESDLVSVALRILQSEEIDVHSYEYPDYECRELSILNRFDGYEGLFEVAKALSLFFPVAVLESVRDFHPLLYRLIPDEEMTSLDLGINAEKIETKQTPVDIEKHTQPQVRLIR
jgi:hypothetical protein